jgi:HNH endonuclease.
MKIKYRMKHPKRTFLDKYDNYKKYKQPLMEDFNHRCGYCDAIDTWLGGSRFYHIDHFKPKSLFPHLETEYSNLVYSCPYCNIFKSNDWVEDEGAGYIDPCHEEYSNHFFRDRFGNIQPETKQGSFISKKLHLYLIRHSVLWNLARLEKLIVSIHELIETKKYEGEAIQRLKERHYVLTKEFFRYMGEFRKTQNSG